jgi:hypothetical protein
MTFQTGQNSEGPILCPHGIFGKTKCKLCTSDRANKSYNKNKDNCIREVLCGCKCGEIVKIKQYQVRKSYIKRHGMMRYINHHGERGKTFEEIHGIKMAYELKQRYRDKLTGKKLEPEHREKVIKTLIPLKKGQTSFFRGRHHTQEAKYNISLHKIGSNNHNYGKSVWNSGKKGLQIAWNRGLPGPSGPNHPNWQGGISFEPYSPEFNKQIKAQIRQRDNYVCQLCGITEEQHKEKLGRNLAINHIDYNKKNSVPKNLITLCINCNFRVNTNRVYWTEYFHNLLKQRNAGLN